MTSVLKAVEEDADVEPETAGEVVRSQSALTTRQSFGVRDTSMPTKGATAMNAYLCMAA